MTGVALIRGINVGGRNKVDMRRLAAALTTLGLRDVETYINSGNVIFDWDDERGPAELTTVVERVLDEEFGVSTPVIVLTASALAGIVEALPADWRTDSESRCEVIFLGPGFDEPDVLDQLPLRPQIDEAMYAPGAVIWRFDRSNANRSGLSRFVGTDLYRAATIRNSTTARTLAELVGARDPERVDAAEGVGT